MDKTALEQKIEARATKKLLKDLYDVSEKEKDIADVLGYENYQPKVKMAKTTNNGKDIISTGNDYSVETFNRLLPEYIDTETEVILSQVDDWMKAQKTPASTSTPDTTPATTPASTSNAKA